MIHELAAITTRTPSIHDAIFAAEGHQNILRQFGQKLGPSRFSACTISPEQWGQRQCMAYSPVEKLPNTSIAYLGIRRLSSGKMISQNTWFLHCLALFEFFGVRK